MSCFKVKIYLPFSKEHILIKQFSNITHKTLVKYLSNKDTDLLNDYIDEMLDSHCSISVKHYSIIDKFVILLNLRCISIGDTIIHTIEKDKVKHNLNYNIYDIIKNISDTCNFEAGKTIVKSKFKIKTGLPKKIFVQIDELSNFIDSLVISNCEYKTNNIPQSVAKDLINSLPGQFLHELYAEMQLITTNINKIKITNFKTNLDTTEIQTLYMYLDKDNMFKIFEIFFNDLLTNYFVKQFILSKEYNISCEYFDSLPPIEADIFFNFHKELEDKSEKTTSTPNIPLPPYSGDIG